MIRGAQARSRINRLIEATVGIEHLSPRLNVGVGEGESRSAGS